MAREDGLSLWAPWSFGYFYLSSCSKDLSLKPLLGTLQYKQGMRGREPLTDHGLPWLPQVSTAREGGAVGGGAAIYTEIYSCFCSGRGISILPAWPESYWIVLTDVGGKQAGVGGFALLHCPQQPSLVLCSPILGGCPSYCFSHWALSLIYCHWYCSLNWGNGFSWLDASLTGLTSLGSGAPLVHDLMVANTLSQSHLQLSTRISLYFVICVFYLPMRS